MKYQLIKSFDELKTKAEAWWGNQGIDDRDSGVYSYEKLFTYPLIVQFGLHYMDDGEIARISINAINRDDIFEIFELAKDL